MRVVAWRHGDGGDGGDGEAPRRLFGSLSSHSTSQPFDMTHSFSRNDQGSHSTDGASSGYSQEANCGMAEQMAALHETCASLRMSDEEWTPTVGQNGTSKVPCLSATAARREERLAKRAEHKLLKRAHKKQLCSEEKAARALEKAKLPVSAQTEAEKRSRWEQTTARHQLQEQRARVKECMRQAWSSNRPCLVIDFSLDGLMCPRERASLSTQVVNSYAQIVKRCSSNPDWQPLGLGLSRAPPDGDIMQRLTSAGGIDNWPVPHSSDSFEIAARTWWDFAPFICMLSPDADEPLDGELLPGVYVIGGLCDYRRVTNATRDLAEIRGVRCRRLPIRENLGNISVEILTVDQVAITLLEVANNGGDWTAALTAAIPPRKLTLAQPVSC